MKRKHETVIWACIWLIVFLLVPLTLLEQFFSEDPTRTMHHVLDIWGSILPFFIMFLIHHFLLVPLVKKRLPLYLVLTTALIGLFVLYVTQFVHMPAGPPGWPGDGMAGPPMDANGLPPKPPGGLAPIRADVMYFLMGILIIGVDLGAFFYVEALRNERKVKQLASDNVSQQLESLRYQINPHFFMNTLNNIHALVDIDPEKAKESIEEFSKMMRILLYEGNAPVIPLIREIDYIEHLISLMRMRFPEESVEIETSFVDDYSEASIPPLLLASFVENAFKHGISYNEKSFVRVAVSISDGKILFRCTNSDHPANPSVHHGLGLDNIHKRLSLLYGTDYELTADTADGIYDVKLMTTLQPTTIAL